MRKTAIYFFLFLFAAGMVNAQEQPLNNGVGFGFQIGQYQKDFQVGINVTSPFFAGKHSAVRLRANLAFNEHENTSGNITWTPYSNLSLGFIGVGGIVAERIRLYGEGGMVCILPAAEFSGQQYSLGGYGVFGFEFFMAPMMNYFIEIGGVGTGAVADKIAKNPIYSNGLLLNAGFRFSLK